MRKRDILLLLLFSISLFRVSAGTRATHLLER